MYRNMRFFSVFLILVAVLASSSEAKTSRKLTKAECQAVPLQTVKRHYLAFLKWYKAQQAKHTKIAAKMHKIQDRNEELFAALLEANSMHKIEDTLEDKFSEVPEQFNKTPHCWAKEKLVFKGRGNNRVAYCVSIDENGEKQYEETPDDFGLRIKTNYKSYAVIISGYSPPPSFDSPYVTTGPYSDSDLFPDARDFMLSRVIFDENDLPSDNSEAFAYSDKYRKYHVEQKTGFASKPKKLSKKDFKALADEFFDFESFYADRPECLVEEVDEIAEVETPSPEMTETDDAKAKTVELTPETTNPATTVPSTDDAVDVQ